MLRVRLKGDTGILLQLLINLCLFLEELTKIKKDLMISTNLSLKHKVGLELLLRETLLVKELFIKVLFIKVIFMWWEDLMEWNVMICIELD